MAPVSVEKPVIARQVRARQTCSRSTTCRLQCKPVAIKTDVRSRATNSAQPIPNSGKTGNQNEVVTMVQQPPQNLLTNSPEQASSLVPSIIPKALGLTEFVTVSLQSANPSLRADDGIQDVR